MSLGTVLEVRAKNDSMSRALSRILLTIYVKRIKNKVNFQLGGNFTELRKEVDPLLENVLRRYMIKSAERGGQRVIDRLNIDTLPFYNIDQKTLDLIDTRIRNRIDRFWRRIEKVERRRQQIKPLAAAAISDITIDPHGKVTEPENQLNYGVIITAMAIQAIVNAYNVGETSAPPQAMESVTDSEELTRINNMRWRFVTKRDSKVCQEFCAPLEGTEYTMNDPNIPQPQLHDHCRCILEIVQ